MHSRSVVFKSIIYLYLTLCFFCAWMIYGYCKEVRTPIPCAWVTCIIMHYQIVGTMRCSNVPPLWVTNPSFHCCRGTISVEKYQFGLGKLMKNLWALWLGLWKLMKKLCSYMVRVSKNVESSLGTSDIQRFHFILLGTTFRDYRINIFTELLVVFWSVIRLMHITMID